MGGPDMGGLILYGACDWGPGIVRNVPNPARFNPCCNSYDKKNARHFWLFKNLIRIAKFL